MRTNDPKCDKLRILLECYGQELGLPIPIRVIVIRLAISDYMGEAASFSQCLAEGREAMDAIAYNYAIQEKNK